MSTHHKVVVQLLEDIRDGRNWRVLNACNLLEKHGLYLPELPAIRKSVEASLKDKPYYDGSLLRILRNHMPYIMALEICGVQPIAGPAGQIFSMRIRYSKKSRLRNTYDYLREKWLGSIKKIRSWRSRSS